MEYLLRNIVTFLNFNSQEWAAFTGMIVSDVKPDSGGKDIPNWVEPDRAGAIQLLKVCVILCACAHTQALYTCVRYTVYVQMIVYTEHISGPVARAGSD